MADKTVIYSIIGVVGIGVAIFAVSRIVESVVQSGRLKPVSSNPEKKDMVDTMTGGINEDTRKKLSALNVDKSEFVYDKTDNFAGIGTKTWNAEVRSQWQLDYGAPLPDVITNVDQFSEFDKHMRSLHSLQTEMKQSGTMVSNAEQFAKNIENQKWNGRRIQEQREAESKKAKGQQSTTDAYVAARIAEMNARNAQPLPPAANPQPGPSKVNIPKVDGLGQNGGHNPLYQKQSGDPQTVSMPGTMYNIVMQN